MRYRLKRVISFRLPEEDYQALVRLCKKTQSRSFSEAARKVVHEWLQQGGAPRREVEDKLSELERRVAELTAQVEALGRRNCLTAGR